ncbi:MAG TPA: hypothetical protein VLG38_02430 [Gammaproteobacteria bacterium]|nr:hypothetical protein [Gammaproteobacteria bacterium]
MRGNNQRQEGDRLSMTLSVFIALCVVSIFCAVSIVVVENIDNISRHHKAKRMSVQNNVEFTKFVF